MPAYEPRVVSAIAFDSVARLVRLVVLLRLVKLVIRLRRPRRASTPQQGLARSEGWREPAHQLTRAYLS